MHLPHQVPGKCSALRVVDIAEQLTTRELRVHDGDEDPGYPLREGAERNPVRAALGLGALTEDSSPDLPVHLPRESGNGADHEETDRNQEKGSAPPVRGLAAPGDAASPSAALRWRATKPFAASCLQSLLRSGCIR